MHSRRIACLLLGLWFGAGLWMQWVASQNVSSVDRLLLRPSPDATAYVKTLNLGQVAPLARYLAAEQNRSLFEIWGDVQIVLSGLFFFLLLFGTRLGKFPLALALLLLLIVVGERMAVTPGMTSMGRATDFTADPGRRVRLMNEAFSYGYNVAETAKWALGAVMAGLLIWQRSSRSLDARDELDVIDKANYRHINR